MISWLTLPPRLSFALGTTTLVAGPSGVGKSGLLLALAGLLSEARVTNCPWPTPTHPHPLAHVYARGHGALLFQNPADGLCTDRIDDELALGMEACGFSVAVMHHEINRWVSILGLQDYRAMPVSELSGGFQQRLAMGAIMSAGPEVLLIDEALSQLDPDARELLLRAYDTWRGDHPSGVAIIVEHRPELWKGRFNQSLLWVNEGWIVTDPPATSVQERPTPTHRPEQKKSKTDQTAWPLVLEDLVPGRPGSQTWSWSEGLSLQATPGSIIVLVGPNGGGKSTLLQTMAGLIRPARGRVNANQPAMALQNPELQFGPGLVADHDPNPDFPGLPHTHSPFALSLGQQRRLSLSMLPKTAMVYLLDEPFYGQDASSVRAIIIWMQAQTQRGAVIVMSCHDHDLAWSLAHQVIHVDKTVWHFADPPSHILPWWESKPHE